MKSLMALLLMSLFSLSLYSQNLDELPVETRDSILVARTKAAVMKHGSEFWRDYKAPQIEARHISPYGGYPKEDVGRKYYKVNILYDKSKEKLWMEWIAQVCFWADNGEIDTIGFGNGYIFTPYDNDHRIVHYQSWEDQRKSGGVYNVENEPVVP